MKTVNTGVSISEVQLERWNQIACDLGLSRNAAFGVILDSVEVQTKQVVVLKPVIVFNPGKNSRNARTLLSESIATGL